VRSVITDFGALTFHLSKLTHHYFYVDSFRYSSGAC
jgi:hypothetical protein